VAIDRGKLIGMHNPVLDKIDYNSPLSIGNGEFAFTADITGLQTLYDEYNEKSVPLCTMSQWGWHTTPADRFNNRHAYTFNDLVMTDYKYDDRTVTYAVECRPGNEDVYYWLRKNPHKFNLGRLTFLYGGDRIRPEDMGDIKQTLYLYEGILESLFKLHGTVCKVRTCCHYETGTIAVEAESELFKEGLLSVALLFPYASPEISASDWNNDKLHESRIVYDDGVILCIERKMDRTLYYAWLRAEKNTVFKRAKAHDFRIESCDGRLSFTLSFRKDEASRENIPDVKKTFESSIKGWRDFWENGGIVKLHNSKDERAVELERRIILSRYQLKVHCCGSLPPQETGLFCNSWHGKFHLEMHLWHQAYLPLWNHADLLITCIDWYLDILPRAKANASRNGFSGAKWPKQVAYDGIDSPSPIATLLIWQQPHIIYMLELLYKYPAANKIKGTKNWENTRKEFLERYYVLIKETADYMADLVVYNKTTKRFDLVPPLIPAQEAHDPKLTLNPVFEVEYWRFGLLLAAEWAKRLGREEERKKWHNIAENMAKLPVKDGLYIAHENCPDTYERYNVDHPIMAAVLGLIPGDRVDKEIMKNTLDKIIRCWDFTTTWGWDFALLAMTAVRLGYPDLAIELLLMDTPNNNYAGNGHNVQVKRKDLPVYLPGNGSLLLAVAMMTAGFPGCTDRLPGFPKDGSWNVEYENIYPFPY